MKRKKSYRKNYKKAALLAVGILMAVVCWQSLKEAGDAPAMKELLRQAQSNLYVAALRAHIPAVTVMEEQEGESSTTLVEYFLEKVCELLPVQVYAWNHQEYDTQVESALTYEMLMTREGVDEHYQDGELVASGEGAVGGPDGISESGDGTSQEGAEAPVDTAPKTQETAAAGNAGPALEPVVQISREKLNDFDYLVQNFYTVDRTTTIDGSQLNAQELLGRDMRLTTTPDQPQILIHHTHSQEGYADSTGDSSTSIVAVGSYLTKLLTEQYGFNVIHDTGEYDVIDHDNAYSYAGPAVERILAEHPSIEVVIDVHRDGIGSGKLVTEVNGKPTAQIMFFNGLSRTTSNGDLAYLNNPYIQDNLAFSLQTKLKGEEYYPGFTRSNYLKGYRYNLHYRPKSMLVEVGAQTNTFEEAMNAMEPLADMLHKVLSP